jgi:hypothetical protein
MRTQCHSWLQTLDIHLNYISRLLTDIREIHSQTDNSYFYLLPQRMGHCMRQSILFEEWVSNHLIPQDCDGIDELRAVK